MNYRFEQIYLVCVIKGKDLFNQFKDTLSRLHAMKKLDLTQQTRKH